MERWYPRIVIACAGGIDGEFAARHGGVGLGDVRRPETLRVCFVVILRVLHNPQTNLLEVALATRAARVFSGAREDGKQNRRQKCDDGNNY